MYAYILYSFLFKLPLFLFSYQYEVFKFNLFLSI